MFSGSLLKYTFKAFSTNHKYLIAGSSGKIGYSLVTKMVNRYGDDNVILCDESKRGNPFSKSIFERLDVTDVAHYKYLMEKHAITYIVHLTDVPSAFGEKNPYLSMKTNFEGVINAFDMAKEYGAKIFIPSSIAVYGPDVNKVNTPLNIALNPSTLYGVGKHFMENMGNYYYYKHKVDFRSIRYPTIITYNESLSHAAADYATEIFFSLLRDMKYTVPLNPKRSLPFAFIDDIIEGTLAFMETDTNLLTSRVYNMQALSFTPEELVNEIQSQISNINLRYEPDYRDEIVKSWPQTLHDELSRKDWKWEPKYTKLDQIVSKMISSLKINNKK